MALYSEMNLKTFVMIQCKTLSRNYLCTNIFVFYSWFKKIEYIYFPIVKMVANHADIGKVGKMGAGFPSVCSVCSFSEIFTMLS